MKRACVFVLLFALGIMAKESDYLPYNTKTIFEDSLYVDSTETHNTKVFWIDNGAHRSLLIEARDDSSAGWSSDTSAVQIKYMQVWPVDDDLTTNRSWPYFCMLNSKAHPDSTVMHPKNFILFDSLQICKMDTLSVWARDSIAVTASNGDTLRYAFGDSLHLNKTTGFGAFEYSDLPIDYSPAAALRITGKASNSKSGSGSFWRFRVFQELGISTKGN